MGHLLGRVFWSLAKWRNPRQVEESSFVPFLHRRCLNLRYTAWLRFMKIIENILYSALPRNYLERSDRVRQSPWAGPPSVPTLDPSFSASSTPSPCFQSSQGSAWALVCGLQLGFSPLPRHSLAMCVCLNPFGLIPGNYLLLCPRPHLRVTLAPLQPFGKHLGTGSFHCPSSVWSQSHALQHTHTHIILINILYILIFTLIYRVKSLLEMQEAKFRSLGQEGLLE